MNLHTFENLKKQHQSEVPYSNNSYMDDDMDAVKQKIEKRKQKQKRQKAIFFSLVGLVVLFALLFGYSQYKLYVLSREESGIASSTLTQNNNQQPVVNASSTPKEIIQALERHIILPSGEPQIAEIQDVAKLKESQAFFKDAQNGDIIVVYETMIYIYRPSKDVLIATSDISGVGQTKP